MPSVPGWIRAWVIVGVGFVVALTVPTVWLPSDELGLRRFQVEIGPAMTLSQTFMMTADGFHAVEFAATSVGGSVSGNLRLELQEEGSGVVRRTEVRAVDVVSAPVYKFEFPPIGDSKDSVYRLDLLASETALANGVAVWATKGERYSGGTMLINDRERWADLAFTTFAPAGRSSWDRLMDASATQPGLAQLLIGALAAYWILVGIVLRAWWRFPSSTSPA